MEDILTKEDFFTKISEETEKMPSNWREGQKVFNAIDTIFGVAREVQFLKRIDCFHNDEKINEFMEKSYEVYKEHLEKMY